MVHFIQADDFGLNLAHVIGWEWLPNTRMLLVYTVYREIYYTDAPAQAMLLMLQSHSKKRIPGGTSPDVQG